MFTITALYELWLGYAVQINSKCLSYNIRSMRVVSGSSLTNTIEHATTNNLFLDVQQRQMLPYNGGLEHYNLKVLCPYLSYICKQLNE